jgi:2-dehydropantoate 2-reductase
VKIAIVGVGAMGSVYAGLLAEAGHDVWAIDTWADHVNAIRAGGLRVFGASGDRVVRLHATTDPAEAGEQELVVIATKAFHVEAAAEAARPLLGPDTVVLPIQNGLGSVERVVGVLGPERVAVGVVGGFGASIPAPGQVHHNGWELVGLGERDAPASERLERVADAWRQAGFNVQVFDDVRELVWGKLVANTCFSGTCALLGATVGDVLADPDAWAVASACAAETFRVARASGIALSFDDPVAHVRAFGEKIPGARPSMLLDLLAGRRCEIDVINGAVPPAARTVGLEAPTNETVTALVRARERAILAGAVA